MGIVEKTGDSLFDNTVGIVVTPITNKIIEPIKETIEEETNKKRKRDILNEIYEYGLNFYGNEVFFDAFQKKFFNDKNLSFIYDSFFIVQSNEELNSPNKVVSHFYKPDHYDTAYRNSVKTAIWDIVNKIHYMINKPTNSSERIIQNLIHNSTSQITAQFDEQNAKIDNLIKIIEDRFPKQNNFDCLSIKSESTDQANQKSTNNINKTPKYITLYFYNKFFVDYPNADSLFSYLQFSGQEQSFDIVKLMITYEDNSTSEEIINSEINDNIVSFQMPYREEIVKSTKILIKPPRTEYSISIETPDYDVIVPNYHVYFTRERDGDIITTTWNDISVDSTIIINFIVSFSSLTKETTKFKFNINAKNPEDVYSQYHYYKVLNMLKRSDKIIFRDNSTHDILLDTATLNVDISDEDLNIFMKVYNNALWAQDKYGVKFIVPKEFDYEDYVTFELLRSIYENKKYIFPNNYKMSFNVPYDAKYKKQDEFEEDKLYLLGYDLEYIDVWGTRVTFNFEEKVHILINGASLVRSTDEIKVTSKGEIYSFLGENGTQNIINGEDN